MTADLQDLGITTTEKNHEEMSKNYTLLLLGQKKYSPRVNHK